MDVATLLGRARNASFVRFCIIGGVGFVVDAGLLMVLIHGFGLPAVGSRFLSFAGAVLVTFELNRRWTFAGTGRRSYLSQLGAYLSVQSLGFACNLAIYAALCSVLHPSVFTPLTALALASVAALLVNYVGARSIVFRKRPGAPDPGGDR